MTDSEAVLAANSAFYAAFERLDLDAMAGVWSDAVPISCVHPRGDLVEGRDAVLAAWESLFRGTRAIRFDLARVRVFVAGAAAWVVLVEKIESRHGDNVVRAQTQATNIFVREGGAWKLVHHHAEPATAQAVKQKPPPPSRDLN